MILDYTSVTTTLYQEKKIVMIKLLTKMLFHFGTFHDFDP